MQIDRGIPIPPKASGGAGGRASPYPLADMKVGDSIGLDLPDNPARAARRLASAARAFRRRNPDWQFTIRSTPHGARIWRTK